MGVWSYVYLDNLDIEIKPIWIKSEKGILIITAQ